MNFYEIALIVFWFTFGWWARSHYEPTDAQHGFVILMLVVSGVAVLVVPHVR